MRNKQHGFSLIELLIVVVIIGIISAIAIPNLISARRAANEGSALASNRVLHTAQIAYGATVGNGSYAPDVAALGSRNFIDQQLATGTKSGFIFVTKKTDRVVGTTEPSFTIGAVPTITTQPMQTGGRKFCVALEGVVRSHNTALGTNIAANGNCTAANYPVIIQ